MKMKLTDQTYVRRMEPKEMHAFFEAGHGWDLFAQHGPDFTQRHDTFSEKVTDSAGMEVHLGHPDEIYFQKPVAVLANDGVVYSGYAETVYHLKTRGTHAVMMHFFLGENQDSKSLDEKMEGIEFKPRKAAFYDVKE